MNCFLREQLNHLLVVPVSILSCLLFLSILVASGPYLTLSGLIIICIYLLLRCLLSDICSCLFSMVIMLSPLIYRMLIYIFLLLNIIIISYILFGIMCLISGRFLPFGLPTAPWVFTALTKPILFLCHHKGFCIGIYLDDIMVLVHSKQAGKMAHLFLCSLLVQLGLHIHFSKSDLCLTQTCCFLGLCWDTVTCQYLYLLIS